jgi:hypothetical protein
MSKLAKGKMRKTPAPVQALSLVDRLKALEAVGGPVVQVPYHVWTLFGDNQKEIYLYGSEVCLGEDPCSVAEAQAALQWYVEQFGGSVKWGK